ncbi:MAG: hypothetical protein KKA16_03360 [Alphaproteobacteria bacterium]|nr:hypothetical protein [Alphaproteobacteria bacterium]MBU2378175.1 hypothetical protein [Alphaproteobacteria bacterium]
MTDPDSALTQLNASERELLLLLGQGHTAKSIAALKDLSELAVNERFRTARRKTGIGSSREIARLLTAQENRDDISGVAEPAAPTPSLPRPGAPRRASPLRRWSLPMSAAAFLIASTILAQQTAVPPERPLPPAVVAMFTPPDPAPDIVALHAEIATGPADPEWSRATEAALSRIYQRAIDPSGALASLDTTCNASLCEVIGVSRAGLTDDQITALTTSVQGRETNEAITAMKLDNIVSGFHSTTEGGPADIAGTVVFAAYWRRAD